MRIQDGANLRGYSGKLLFVAGCENRSGDQLAHAAEVVLVKAARGSGGGPDTNAAGHEGRTRLVGNGVLVHGDTNALKKLLGVFARDIGRGQDPRGTDDCPYRQKPGEARRR